ncbi:receptor-like protein EIX2 [Salvia hispanica]|uniref:receptor-like protein EIX2 n=1 Tax=Salvia hispanica TaxID=49212 RepID=UPI002009D379|nr:receptor-like protein EIX2 [Salvia hispanica]
MIGCQNTAALGQFSYLERLRNSDLNSLTPPLTQVIAPSMSKVAMQPNVIVQPVEPKGNAEVRCIQSEREALLSFKSGLIDDYGFLSLWQSTECCKCSNDFGSNPIPEFIGFMKQLQHLFLMGSNFFGIVPPHLGNLTNLRTLGLSHNSLRLDSCNISTILVEPSANSSSTSLSILTLSHNHLTSSSFHWLPNISTSLVEIDISDNALAFPIPDAFIEGLLFIEHLDLSYNMLEGQMPKSLWNLSHLCVLVLYENDLTGNLDELFGNTSDKGILESLQILDLAHNKLNGPVPDLSTFTTLLEVYFESNNFTGFIPLSIGQLSELRVLDLSDNLLEGLIPDIGEMEMLECLDLSKNQLFGKIPTSMTQLWLSVLDLSNNSLSGKIPTSTQLQSFNASAYARNDGLCGAPLVLCAEDILKPPTTNSGGNTKEKNTNLSFMQEVGISMAFGFIF